jgi:hypothetical protein
MQEDESVVVYTEIMGDKPAQHRYLKWLQRQTIIIAQKRNNESYSGSYANTT